MQQEIKTAGCRDIVITNRRSQAVWNISLGVRVPLLPLPSHYNIRVGATHNSQPPASFLDYPTDQFVIQGRYEASLDQFESGAMSYNAGLSEPPDIYTFSI
jgi:hypothetical protein